MRVSEPPPGWALAASEKVFYRNLNHRGNAFTLLLSTKRRPDGWGRAMLCNGELILEWRNFDVPLERLAANFAKQMFEQCGLSLCHCGIHGYNPKRYHQCYACAFGG